MELKPCPFCKGERRRTEGRTMDDLISRAALLRECEERQKSNPLEDGCGWADLFLNDAQCPSTEWDSVEEMIEGMPAVDAVHVVRCKDCKYWVCADVIGAVRYGDCTNSHAIISRHAMPNENYYCADGERKDGDA